MLKNLGLFKKTPPKTKQPKATTRPTLNVATWLFLVVFRDTSAGREEKSGDKRFHHCPDRWVVFNDYVLIPFEIYTESCGVRNIKKLEICKIDHLFIPNLVQILGFSLVAYFGPIAICQLVILPMSVISISNKMTSKMPGFQRKKFIK